jgi:protein-tyrosine phosphatase
MNHRLSDRVSWGDRFSPGELKNDVGAVVCLCENAELAADPACSPFAQLLPNHPKPYLWLPINDYHQPTEAFFAYLDTFLLNVKRNGVRLLVHCWAGHHRSPAIAIYSERILSGGMTLDALKATKASVEAMEPKVHYLTFSTAVHEYLEMLCRGEST